MACLSFILYHFDRRFSQCSVIVSNPTLRATLKGNLQVGFETSSVTCHRPPVNQGLGSNVTGHRRL